MTRPPPTHTHSHTHLSSLGLKGPLRGGRGGNRLRRVRDLPVVTRHVSTELGLKVRAPNPHLHAGASFHSVVFQHLPSLSFPPHPGHPGGSSWACPCSQSSVAPYGRLTTKLPGPIRGHPHYCLLRQSLYPHLTPTSPFRPRACLLLLECLPCPCQTPELVFQEGPLVIPIRLASPASDFRIGLSCAGQAAGYTCSSERTRPSF